MGRKKWTKEEIKIATDMKNEGKSNKEIGLFLNRSPKVIYNKMLKLGVIKHTTSKKHIYEVGEIVNGNLKIIEQLRAKEGNYTSRSYKVKSTNYYKEPAYEVSESSLKKGHGCAYTAGRRATENNNLWNVKNTRKNIVNIDEAKATTPYSNKKILFKCSTENCDYTRMAVVSSIVKNGFSCPNCSKGISYPERFMLAVNDFYSLSFEYQETYENGRFDFINHKTKVIVEMNGRQHYEYENSWKDSYRKTKLSDDKKRQWAKENSYNLIFIDARKSEFEFIKNNINNCELLPNIEDKDENAIMKIIESYSKYDTQKIINYYNIDKLTTYQIGEKIGATNVTVGNILRRNGIKLRKGNTRTVRCIETGIVYASTYEASRKVDIAQGNISTVCRGGRKTAGGYHWEYAD